MAPPMIFDPLRFVTELAYTLFLVVACFMIYFKTRESYELTKHKGIMFFRDAFLFFGISYLTRFIIFITRISTMDAGGPGMPRSIIFPLSLLITGYLSTMGITYLMFSSIWKNIEGKRVIIITHIVALVLSAAAFFMRSQDMLALLQLVMLIITAIIMFASKSQHKKISQTRILYGLILLFWLADLWMMIPRGGVFSFELKIVLQITSIIVFIIMYAKVSKWIK